MADSLDLPQEGDIVPFGLFASIFSDRIPENHPDLGFYFVMGINPLLRKWEVFPPKERISLSRTVPLASSGYAICLVDNYPQPWIEKIRVIEVVERGVVRGEYFQP